MILNSGRFRVAFLLMGAFACAPAAFGQGQGEAGAAFERWERILRHASYARIELRSSRTSFNVDDDGAMSTDIRNRHEVTAEAMMAADSQFLAVWEINEEGEKSRKDPILVLGFADGTIHERLWHPEVEQYRTRRYAAPTPGGADDTDYIHGCQIGEMLSSWLGESRMVESGQRLRSGNAGKLTLMAEHDATMPGSWIAVRSDKLPMIDPESGVHLYQRTDDYWFDEAGILRRWRTTVYQGMDHDRGPYFIVQDQRYSIRFTDEPPRGMAEAIQRMLEQPDE